MTAPVPHTWVDNEFASAAGNLNPGVRDVLAFLLDPPRCTVRQITAGQSLPNAAYTALTWNFEDYDNEPAGMHDPNTNPSRITIRTAGTYLCLGGCSFVSGSGRRGLAWYQNAAALPSAQMIMAAGATTGADFVARPIYIACAAGDFIELRAFQDSGAAMILGVGAPGGSSASVRWVGP